MPSLTQLTAKAFDQMRSCRPHREQNFAFCSVLYPQFEQYDPGVSRIAVIAAEVYDAFNAS